MIVIKPENQIEDTQNRAKAQIKMAVERLGPNQELFLECIQFVVAYAAIQRLQTDGSQEAFNRAKGMDEIAEQFNSMLPKAN